MSNFVKIYETDQYGQILILMQEDDDGVLEIRFFAKPIGLGVSSVALKFGDRNDDESWDRQKTAWGEITEETTTSVVKSLFKMVLLSDSNNDDE